MTTDRIPHDPALPGAAGLLAEPGRRAVATLLERRGWQARELRAVQAIYRPGREGIVRYLARANDGTGAERRLSLAVETRASERTPVDPDPRLGARFGLPEPVERIGPYLAWAFPYDPAIPGLPHAMWGPAVREALAPQALAVSVQPLRYRPRRRALFRYRVIDSGGERSVYFGKALRPSRHRRAMRLAGRLSAPRDLLLAHPRELPPLGTLATRALPGRSIRSLLLAGGSLPAPHRLAEVPMSVARIASADGPAPDPVREARSAARLIATLAPAAAPAAAAVVERVCEGAATATSAPVLVHGDLYEDQVIVGPGFRLGLVDLDDVGPGDPLGDAGTFCAHLVALALAVPGAARRCLAYRALVRRAFLERLGVSEADLAWREGLAMLRLAAGPFRVLMPSWPGEVHRRANVALRLARGG